MSIVEIHSTPSYNSLNRKSKHDLVFELLSTYRFCGQKEEKRQEYQDALTGMVYQFAYWSDKVGGFTTGGLSALEEAFGALHWDDPHPCPELCCDELGCKAKATCGWPSTIGYRRTCGKHYQR